VRESRILPDSTNDVGSDLSQFAAIELLFELQR